MQKTDEELVKLVQRGQKDFFGLLIDRYEKKLLSYGLRFLRDMETSEDAIQETFLKAYKNLNSFDTARSFSSWIYRIAHNEVMNQLRFRARVQPNEKLINELVDDGYVEKLYQDLDEDINKSRINDSLLRLTGKSREVIILFYFEEKTYQEISDILHIPIGTVGTLATRAKERLKAHLKEKR